MELLKRLKQNPDTKDIPVFAISARAVPTEIENALHAGFDQYLVKPLNIRYLLELVNKSLPLQ